ncbi:sugar phosphate nucleotidyltransferase [Bosea sp. F3-2]|nr:sugar phosphate nucleotidyltransferase [Bosea sp. F3-2]
MAGGAGTRLWPVSRDSMPKQFIDLLGDGLYISGHAPALDRGPRNSGSHA